VTPTPLATGDLDALDDASTLVGRLFAELRFPWLVIGPDGAIRHANEQAAEAFGWSVAELIGQPVERLVPLRHREAHAGHRARFVRKGQRRTMADGLEVTALRRDGSEFFVHVELSTLPVGTARYVVVTLRDVTAGHQEAERLRDLADRLATANHDLRVQSLALAKLDGEKNALLGMAAHDLRTPLAVVLGYAELLTSAPPAEPLREHKAMVDAILGTAKLMRRILDDLLDWSAIEAGTLRLVSHPVDPMIVAADAVALAGLTAARQGIPLSLEANPELPPIDVDPERISQVLGNLLSNALKYSPAGHPVRLHVGRHGADMIEFAVIDRGQGIPAEFLAHMFRPFETGGNKAAGGERSYGLGLAIVKRIVDAHGGTVGVESEPGRGSTFRVRLPVGRRGSLGPTAGQPTNRSTSAKPK
jgi:PAS domain S-box-containing protein